MVQAHAGVFISTKSLLKLSFFALVLIWNNEPICFSNKKIKSESCDLICLSYEEELL
jgi:hypothetical protein